MPSIKFPFNFSAEKLYREDSLYNVVCVLNYNTNPITPGLGSAIFIHVAKDGYKPTEGCVALKQKDLIFLLNRIDNKTEIILPRKEFELLFLLASKPGKVFSRDEIMNKVWGSQVVVGDRTIDVHVRKLREKIGEKHIKTLKGVGYKFKS